MRVKASITFPADLPARLDRIDRNRSALLERAAVAHLASMANKPTHTAYSVRDFKKQTGEADSSWSKIGVGFIHEDGKGFDIVLDAFPVSARVVPRLNTPRPKAD